MRKSTCESPFIDWLIAELGLKNNRQLADLLGVQLSTISKIRHGANVSAEFILAVHEATDIPVRAIRDHIPAVS